MQKKNCGNETNSILSNTCFCSCSYAHIRFGCGMCVACWRSFSEFRNVLRVSVCVKEDSQSSSFQLDISLVINLAQSDAPMHAEIALIGWISIRLSPIQLGWLNEPWNDRGESGICGGFKIISAAAFGVVKALISGGWKCSFGDDGAEEGSSVSRVWTQQAIMPLKIKYS